MFAGWSEFKLTGSLSCVGIVGGGVLVGSSCSIDTIVHSEVTFHGQCLLPRGALASTHDRKTKTWATHQHFEICIGHRGCWYLYLWIRLGINWINSIRMLTFRVSYRLILDTPTLRKNNCFWGVTKLGKITRTCWLPDYLGSIYHSRAGRTIPQWCATIQLAVVCHQRSMKRMWGRYRSFRVTKTDYEYLWIMNIYTA